MTDEVTITDFHAFQRDTLLAIRDLETHGDDPYGLAIRDVLEREYDDEINHSRLYQNLDQLVERGLLTKTEVDGRTNSYETTETARAMLRKRLTREADCLGLQLPESRKTALPDGGHDA